MIKHDFKTADQTYLRTVWAWLMSSLIDSSLSNTPSLLRPSYRTKTIVQLLCDDNWAKKDTCQTYRWTDR